MGSRLRLAGLILVSFVTGGTGWTTDYRPALKPPAFAEPFLTQLAPGGDSFPEEKEAAELAARLAGLGQRLRCSPGTADPAFLLAPDFKGAPLKPAEEVTVAAGPAFQVFRAKAPSADLLRGAPGFGAELQALLADLETVEVAEMLVTAIEADRAQGLARIDVRYDLAGRGPPGGRARGGGRG